MMMKPEKSNNHFYPETFPKTVSPVHPAKHAAPRNAAQELSVILAELEAHANRLEASHPNLSMAISIAISLIELNSADTEPQRGDQEF